MAFPFTPPPLVLASQSPRRRELLSRLGLPFRLLDQDVEEVYPPSLAPSQVPSYLAQLKAQAALAQVQSSQEVVLASDTIVLLDEQILGKPQDLHQARQMLQQLSGRKHQVITGVCLASTHKTLCFEDQAFVQFASLSASEIDYYLQQAPPLDRAGSYAIQDWIGLACIQSIEGSYFTVMGLPTHLVYQALKSW